jgi:HEAT repeat protein
LALAACAALNGCAGFWDDITSRDFKFKQLFSKPPPPLWVIRNSTDGDKKGKALLALREPLQHGGTQAEQDEVVQVLTASATSDPQPTCRLAAIHSLQYFKDPRAGKALMDAYVKASSFQRDRPEAFELIKSQVLAALGVNGNPVAVDLLIGLLKAPEQVGPNQDKQQNIDERITVARALAHFPQYQVAEALVAVLRTEQDVALRNRVTESLQTLTGQDLPDNAQVWADFLHKSGDKAIAKEQSAFKSFLRLTSWNPLESSW